MTDNAELLVVQLPLPLQEWMPRQRWFAGKGRPVAEVRLEVLGELDSPEDGRELVAAVATVRYETGPTEEYQVPLSVAAEPAAQLEHAVITVLPDGRTVYDGPFDKAMGASLLRLMADASAAGRVRAGHEPDADLDLDVTSLAAGAEQSNTSLVYGESYFLKLFRKLSRGVNPDLEVTRALGRVGSQHVVPPVGWLETELDREPVTLGVLQPFLRSATDGWAMASTSVRDLYAEADLHADEVGGDFAPESFRLGGATAAVHADLARAFGSRAAGPEESSATGKLMHERLDAALEVVPQLAAFADGVRLVYDRVATLDRPVPVQRIHGDLHLGQVLRTDVGWVLLDFEGEPARPLAERVAQMSPLRDVAGMLRSFDYAARHQLADHPAAPNLAYRATEWADRNRQAFCEGYGRESGRDPRDDSDLLHAFELDKAVYEVVYEARNRPTWLSIPLGSIERLVGAG